MHPQHTQVYCSSHVPKSGPGHLDQTSVGIRQALNVPKTNKYVNEQIRGTRDIDGEFQNDGCVCAIFSK